MKKLITLVLFCCLYVCHGQTLRAYKKFVTNVYEPSDIVYSPDYSKFYIVSDKGILYETDTLGKITRQSDLLGLDYEGVWADDKFLYMADERTRRVTVLNQSDFKVVRQNEIPYMGGMNLGYEGITYNAKKNCFVIVTEKDPCMFFELNSDLVKINEVKMKIASDISALCFYKDFMYALSDEDQCVIKLDPLTYAVIQKWKIAVTNPEGMTFDKEGNLVVVSDMDQMVYKFHLSENAQTQTVK